MLSISLRTAAGVLALAFLAFHLPFLPASLEDVDSINFALGMRDFDVAQHQPHPPGYPVFMLAAKSVHAIVASEPHALSLIGIVAGALSAFALIAFFGALERERDPGPVAMVAALLTMTVPLFWVTAARPLSDVAGLVAAVAVQAAILNATSPRTLIAASFGAGLAAGIRSQVVWLTAPLLLLGILWQAAGSRWRAAAGVALGYAAGALVWLVPLVVLTGGPAAYWQALSSQGSEDFSGVVMLWTTPTVRQLALTLYHAFIAPWGSWQVAVIVLALAAIGIASMIGVRLGSDPNLTPVALLSLFVAYGPYLVFNLIFQESVTTRYALPLVVPIAYLAVRGGVALAGAPALVLVGALAFFNVQIGQSTIYRMSRVEAPAFRMLADMGAAASSGNRGGETPVLAMHFPMRRPVAALDASLPQVNRLPARPRQEWLEVVKYWNDGGRGPVWFAADAQRSDLALIDHRGPRARYEWQLSFPALLGGLRPNSVAWYSFERPMWYLGEGWSLTPETAGVAKQSGHGPGRAPIHGWIRREQQPLNLVIGGRNLAGPTAGMRVTLDDRTIDRADVQPGFFLRMLTLPAGSLAGAGDYAAMAIAADSDQIAIEQFDAQPAGHVVFGFAEGWHEQEYTFATGPWRWTSDRATIRLRAEGHALRLIVRGESEASSVSHVIVRAGDRIVTEVEVGRTFSMDATIPAAFFGPGESTMTIETDQSYVPAERSSRSQDRRRLGLKIYEWRLTPAS